jgi:uncharacterized protein YndB with AHSA1/START domain
VTRIYTTIEIPRPIDVVFSYVTTPGTWPRWHPSSEGVVGATDHSLDVGEQAIEAFFVAGRRGKVTWTVRERVAPTRWVIEGVITTGAGGGGTITYTFRPSDGGTVFEREFVYSMPNPLYAVLDFLVLRRRVEAESNLALRRLRDALIELPAGPGR